MELTELSVLHFTFDKKAVTLEVVKRLLQNQADVHKANLTFLSIMSKKN